MKNCLILAAVSAIAVSSASAAGSKHASAPVYPTYDGLVMAGYQGWFHNPSRGTMFKNEESVRIDMWPDVSEYEKTYPTGLTLADGTPARFFCSDDESTVKTHFRWMKEYGLDGVFLQRFWGSATRPPEKREETVTVMRHALKYAQEYGRALAVMWDLSGLKPGRDDCTKLIDDWKYLVDEIKVTSYGEKNMYLHHRGRPLVVIWGVGFPDRPYSIRDIKLAEFLDFLHDDPEYGGCSVMLGVPTYWRSLDRDCVKDAYLHELIKKADVVLPWMVGRFTPLLYSEMNRYRDSVAGDIAWCKANGVDYVPIIYPGFSWYNLSRKEKGLKPQPVGSIPREGGRFYWDLAANAIGAGANKIYVAMFDEVNEGTAIFKTSGNVPVGDTIKFLGMEGLPSDHYLRLTGEIAKFLRGERIVRPLGGEGWRLWLDRKAEYKSDRLHINEADGAKIMAGRAGWLKPVEAAKLSVPGPTCGWDALFSKTVDWTRAEEAWKDQSLSLEVSVPNTVENYFFDAVSGNRRGERESGDYKGVSWWGRRFSVPASARGRRVLLRFKEGIRSRAEVFVNRRLVGYELVLQSPFELDVTDAVKFGEENELAVRITDANGNFSWGDYWFAKWGDYMFPVSHGFGGIIGGVDLVVADVVRVDDIFVRNNQKPRDITASVEISNGSASAAKVSVEAEVRENWASSAKVANPETIFSKKLGTVSLAPGETKKVEFDAVVKDARLWDVRNANLYDMVVTLRDADGRVVDRHSARFGFRNIEIRGVGRDAQLFLNGRRVFLLSAISWGFWPANGMIPTPELARRHVESAVKLGMNMINFHRCRGNDSVLDAADEAGVLYYEEPGGFSSYRHKDQNMDGVDQSVAHEICRQKLLRMVKNHRNHPSLAMYNMVNEPGWSPDERAKADMAEAHALDPSRFISYGSGFMSAAVSQPQKLCMFPFDAEQYTTGYCDIHNAGNSPGVYVDANWNSPTGFLRSERDEKEFFVWGEEGALAAPPQLELIRAEKRGRPNGWDGQQYDIWYEGYRRYIEEKGLSKNFPSMTKLITSMGDIMYYEHGRLLENARIADGADVYVLNGYESMKDDNLSGAVDCYRNPKGNPKLIADYMRPLMVSVKARDKLGAVGDVNLVDLHVLNEYVLPPGEYAIRARVKTPTGKVRELYSGKVRVSGGEKFSDLAAEGLPVALDDGPGYYRIASALVDAKGKVFARGHEGRDEIYAVDCRVKGISGKCAIVGGGKEYAVFAKDALGVDLKEYGPGTGKLDCLLVAPTDMGKVFKPVPSFNFRTKDGARAGLDMEHFRGKNFETRLDRRVSTAAIDFDLKAKLIPGYDILGTSDFSVRWEGLIFSDYTGDVEFEYTMDDGTRVWFDGELAVDKWSGGPKTVRTFTRRMVAGERHAIKIEAFQGGGEWISQFKWRLPVPEKKVDWEGIVKRVREDGTTLVLIEGAEENLKKLKDLGAFPDYRVFHPNKTWVGHNMFVRKHPVFEGLPVDCGMNWEYQTLAVYDGPKHFGLVMEGEEPLVGLVGVPLRGIATSVGIVPCGKGRILFSSLDLSPNLSSGLKASVTPKRIFANILKWAERE